MFVLMRLTSYIHLRRVRLTSHSYNTNYLHHVENWRSKLAGEHNEAILSLTHTHTWYTWGLIWHSVTDWLLIFLFFMISTICVHYFLYSVSFMYHLHSWSALYFSSIFTWSYTDPYLCRYRIKCWFSIHTLCPCLYVVSVFHNCANTSVIDM